MNAGYDKHPQEHDYEIDVERKQSNRQSINMSDGDKQIMEGPYNKEMGASDPSTRNSVTDQLLNKEHLKILKENRKQMNMNPRGSLKIYPRLDKGFR